MSVDKEQLEQLVEIEERLACEGVLASMTTDELTEAYRFYMPEQLADDERDLSVTIQIELRRRNVSVPA